MNYFNLFSIDSLYIMSAVNKEMQLTLKPSTVRAKRYTKSIYSLSQNSSYGENDTIVHKIPVGIANTFMDGKTKYLKFVLSITWTADSSGLAADASTVYLDYTASCFFRSLNVYGNSSQKIDTIDRYNVLCNQIYDQTFSQSQMKALSSLIGSAQGDTTDATNRYGMSFKNPTVAADGTASTSATFCIPLFCSTGQLSEKYIPLYAMSGSDISLELVLDTVKNAIRYSAVAHLESVTYAISTPELFVDFIEVDPSAMGAIESLYSGRDIVLHSSSYTTYESSIPANTSGQTQIILPTKLMSAKSLTSVHRTSATQVQAGWSLSCFTNPFLGVNSSWGLSLSGVRMPQKALITRVEGDSSQFLAELQKSNHALAYTEYTGSLPYDCYKSTINTVVGATPNKAGFIVGLNLSSITNSEDSILSGVDFSKETTHIEYNFGEELTSAVLVNTFIYHDILLTIGKDTGILTATF